VRPFHHVVAHSQVAMEGNVLQISIATNILKRQYRTSDKGCTPVWSLRKMLTTQDRVSLLRYGTFDKLRTETDHLARGKKWEFFEWP